jgi:hypothetical protein
MLGYWVLGEWIIGLLAITLLTGKLINGKLSFEINLAKDGIFDIPLFQMRGRNPCLNKPL